MGLWLNPYTGELKWFYRSADAKKARKEGWVFIAGKFPASIYNYYSLKDKNGLYIVVSIDRGSNFNEYIIKFKTVEEWNSFRKKMFLVSQVCRKWEDRIRALKDPGYLHERIRKYLRRKKKIDLRILNLLPEDKRKDLLRLAIALHI
jgi:hypothetical protein